MCRTDIDVRAQHGLRDVLLAIRDSLAIAYGVDHDDVIIGPVDFGPTEP